MQLNKENELRKTLKKQKRRMEIAIIIDNMRRKRPKIFGDRVEKKERICGKENVN